MDDTCIDSNKHKDKGKRDEAEEKEGSLGVRKAQLGTDELLIGDRCWAVHKLDDHTAGKGKDKCSLREKGKSVTTHSVINFLEHAKKEKGGWHTWDTRASMLSSG